MVPGAQFIEQNLPSQSGFMFVQEVGWQHSAGKQSESLLHSTSWQPVMMRASKRTPA